MRIDGSALVHELVRPRSVTWQPALLGLFVAGFAAGALPYLWPLLDPKELAWFGAYLAEALVILPTLALLCDRALRAETRVGRSFWSHWAAGMAAWLSVWILYPFFADRWQEVEIALIVEALYVLWYGCMFAAAIQFDEAPGTALRHQLVRIEKLGLVVLGGALLTGFIILPQVVMPEDSLALMPSYLVYQILDWTLVVLYGALTLRTREPRWRRTFSLVTASLFVWGVLDLLEAWLQLAQQVAVAQSMVNVLWFAPYPLIAAAVWSHSHSSREEPATRPTPPAASETLSAGPTIAPLMAATLLALSNFLADLAGLFPAETIGVRSACFAIALVVLIVIEREHRRVAERHRSRLSEELAQVHKLTAVSSLAGGVADDLTDLTRAIADHADRLDERVTEDHASLASVEAIRSAAQETQELVQRLLALTRRREARTESIDLNAIVVRTAGPLKQLLARDRGAELALRLEPVLPGVVGDAGRIEQVILNLVLNARDAIAEGGRIELATELLPAGERTDDGPRRADEVALVVSDDGCGIDPVTLARVFEPYFTTKVAGSGAGLGLSMAQGIVAEHRGRMEVETEAGKGSSFRVIFPAGSA